jgi:hypothetical protein
MFLHGAAPDDPAARALTSATEAGLEIVLRLRDPVRVGTPYRFARKFTRRAVSWPNAIPGHAADHSR